MEKNMLVRTALVMLLAILLAGCNGFTAWVYDTAIDAERNRAGLVSRSLETDDGIKWFYLHSEEGEDLDPVFLIHGFGADSSNWLRFVNELEGEYNFIVPDLPGHGETTRTLSLDYSIDRQAGRIISLADALGVENFHIAGNSMGGAISLAVALQAPERVQSLGLIDSAGVTLVTPEFLALLGDVKTNPLIPHSAEDMFITMDWAMADPPWMPDFFVMHMGRLKAANSAVAEKVYHDINTSIQMRDQLAAITAPTLILWGAEDRLLGVDNVAVFNESIRNSRAVILENIGHVPMAEAAAKSADAFRPFWQEADTISGQSAAL
jgi:pimeloyl-ACP methyl ester carboxylesterase